MNAPHHRPVPSAPIASRVGDPADDDGVALVSALLAILITAGLGLLLLGMITSQLTPTQQLDAGSRAIFAAETGANAVIGQIRTAAGARDATGTVYGDTTRLPCSATGPVGTAASPLRYTATVVYYTADPTGMTAAERAAHDLVCKEGTGPDGDPEFAVVTATGSGETVRGVGTGPLERTVSEVYRFTVTNVNIPGGLIYSFDNNVGAGRPCLQAVSAAVNSTVTYVAGAECGSHEDRQLWLYDTDYTIKLASTTLPTSATGPLCLTGPVAPEISGTTTADVVVLRPCAPVSAPAAERWNQLWSWEGGAQWRGQNESNTGYSKRLLSSGGAGVPTGRLLKASTFDQGNTPGGAFDPEPRVGAGPAGQKTSQIVSYLEFGRCFDVTDEDVNKAYMIVYPCKQDPSPGGTKLAWNHKWFYSEPVGAQGTSAPQLIWVMKNNTSKYCLTSQDAEGANVRLTAGCDFSHPGQQWTRYADTGNYASSYTFVDGFGRCIALNASVKVWSTMATRTCDGGLGQKWNAEPGLVTSSVDGYREAP